MNSDERALVERIRDGDRHAFEGLFRTHYSGLVRFARIQLGNGAEAEDVVHDVFLRIWRDRGRLVIERSFRTYLLAAVRNRVRDLLRHRAVERRWIDPLTGAYPSEVPTPAPHSDAAAVAELEAAIRQAVDALPDRCRTAFLLCREQELTYAEAAEVMEVRPATVKTQMARALASLRTALEPFLVLLLLLLVACLYVG
jgi:RNA polymerase sigma-70 factor (ECF subfamily)